MMPLGQFPTHIVPSFRSDAGRGLLHLCASAAQIPFEYFNIAVGNTIAGARNVLGSIGACG